MLLRMKRSQLALIFSLCLPTLALAGDKDRDHDRDDRGIGWGRDKDKDGPPVSAVPEANTGLVLIPVMGAILLFSTVRHFRTRQKV